MFGFASKDPLMGGGVKWCGGQTLKSPFETKIVLESYPNLLVSHTKLSKASSKWSRPTMFPGIFSSNMRLSSSTFCFEQLPWSIHPSIHRDQRVPKRPSRNMGSAPNSKSTKIMSLVSGITVSSGGTQPTGWLFGLCKTTCSNEWFSRIRSLWDSWQEIVSGFPWFRSWILGLRYFGDDFLR